MSLRDIAKKCFTSALHVLKNCIASLHICEAQQMRHCVFAGAGEDHRTRGGGAQIRPSDQTVSSVTLRDTQDDSSKKRNNTIVAKVEAISVTRCISVLSFYTSETAVCSISTFGGYLTVRYLVCTRKRTDWCRVPRSIRYAARRYSLAISGYCIEWITCARTRLMGLIV